MRQSMFYKGFCELKTVVAFIRSITIQTSYKFKGTHTFFRTETTILKLQVYYVYNISILLANIFILLLFFLG
jgi:hypothetical protein